MKHVAIPGVPVAPHADSGLRSRMHRFGQQGRNNRTRLHLATRARACVCVGRVVRPRRRHDVIVVVVLFVVHRAVADTDFQFGPLVDDRVAGFILLGFLFLEFGCKGKKGLV